MGKRKQPERGAAAGAAAKAAATPPRLGDHASSMAEPMLLLADVHIKVKGGTVLPAHAVTLVQHCATLARSSELFADATSKAPAALSSPFDEYEEADVARFLECIYRSAYHPPLLGPDAAVVRLAHALDSALVLAGAQRHLAQWVRTRTAAADVAAAAELAALCGWDDLRATSASALAERLQAPLVAAAAPSLLALSDAHAFEFARGVIDHCPPELAARAVGTLAANYRRLHAEASAAARASALSPAATATALAAAGGAALALDGCFVALLNAHGPASAATFESHGRGWELLLQPPVETDGDPSLGLRLVRGAPAEARYDLGFRNLLGDGGMLERGDEDVFFPGTSSWVDLDLPAAEFHDPAEGWAEHGRAAPFVRILSLSDLPPREARATPDADFGILLVDLE